MIDAVDWTAVIKGVDWTTVLVALVTGVTAAGGPYLIWLKQAKSERRSVRAALLAEVSALIEIVEIRGYLRDLRAAEAALSNLEQWQLDTLSSSDFQFQVPIGEHYNRVYQSNVNRLGSLSAREARMVVRFYQLADSVKADISEGGVLFIGSLDAEDFKDAADILETAMELGRQFVDSTPWWQFWNCGRIVDVDGGVKPDKSSA